MSHKYLQTSPVLTIIAHALDKKLTVLITWNQLLRVDKQVSIYELSPHL